MCEKCETDTTAEKQRYWVIVAQGFEHTIQEEKYTLYWKDKEQILAIESKDQKYTVYIPYASIKYAIRVNNP